MRKNLITLVALAAAAFTAHAAAPLTPYTGELPPVMKYARTTGLQIFKKFPAADGLTGWVVRDEASGKDIVVMTTPNGGAMLAGMIVDKDGKNLTAQYMADHVPPPDFSAALNDFSKGATVTVGKKTAKAELIVAFDPNCGYCKVLHRLLEPAVAAGELRVKYVPVAILGGDSDQKAAGLLAAKDGEAELIAVSNGERASLSSDPALLAKVQSNTQLMRKHGFNGTPAVLYKAKYQGEDTVFTANGVPNIPELFQRLGISGQTDKLKGDPALARFLK